MDTVAITVHGGKECRNCLWKDAGCFGYDDYITDVSSDYAVVALDSKAHVAGIWKFDKPYYRSLVSCATWVASKYRKRGLAKRLWEVGLTHTNPIRVKVRATSDRGYTLVCSLEEMFPDISWTIMDKGDRELRRLKKAEVQ